MPRQYARRGFAHMANAQGKNEAVERNVAPLVNRIEKFDDTVFQRADFVARTGSVAPEIRWIVSVTRAQCKNIIGATHQTRRPIIVNLLIAEPFNIQRLTRYKMFEPFARLRLARQTARAAQNNICLTVFAQIARRRRAAGRTRFWKRERHGSGRARITHHAHNLGYHIARALDDYRVANADILARNLIGIMQGGIAHAHATNRDLLQFGNRRKRTCAPHLNVDILQHGCRLLRRKFMCDRPARRARYKAQPVLIVERINLIDHAVNVISQKRPTRLDILPMRQQFLRAGTHAKLRINGKPPSGEQPNHAGLGLRGQVGHLAPRISKKPQRPRGRDGRIKLAQTACRRVAGIGKFGLSGRFLAFIERVKIFRTHINLATHFRDFRRAFRQRVRNAGNGFQIFGDIFAHAPIATRCTTYQHTIFIAQRRRQTVNFGLRG